MDPDEALDRLLVATERLRNLVDPKVVDSEIAEVAEEIQEVTQALAEWRKKGGFLPSVPPRS